MSTGTYHHFAKPPAAGAPLVFAFHGTGGNEQQFVGLVEEILPDAGLVAPRGDVFEHGANRFFRRTAEGIYDMDDLAVRAAAMTAFVRAHRASNPEAEVYGLGYSNGANILAAVLFEAPELFDRAVLMHPLIPWRPAPQPALLSRSVLITAGRQDPICPLPQTEALMAYFEGEGARVELSLHDGGHEIWPEEISAVREFLRRQHGRTAAGQYNQYQGS